MRYPPIVERASDARSSTGSCVAPSPRLHTDDTVRCVVARISELKDEGVSVAEMQHSESMLGYGWNKYQMVGSGIDLNVVSSVMYDWCHCYLQDGLGDFELGLFMKVHRAVHEQWVVEGDPSRQLASVARKLSGLISKTSV